MKPKIGLAVLLLGATAGVTRAERVLVLAGGEARCVRAAELAAAISRHGELASVVRELPRGSRAALVRVRGEAGAVVVEVALPGAGSAQRELGAMPCPAAVEVAAAFVVSVVEGEAVAVAPVRPQPPGSIVDPFVASPRLPIHRLRTAVVRELARRGLDLAGQDMQLGLTRAGDAFVVTLVHGECERSAAVPAPGSDVVGALVTAALTVDAAPDGCRRERFELALRRKLLRETLPREARGWDIFQTGLGLGVGLLALPISDRDARGRSTMMLGGGTVALGGALGLLSRDRAGGQTVSEVGLWAGFGLVYLGIDQLTPGEQPSVGALAGAFLTNAILTLSAGLKEPPTARARLTADYHRLRARGELTHSELARMESDLRQSRPASLRVAHAISFFVWALYAATASEPPVAAQERDPALGSEAPQHEGSAKWINVALLGTLGLLQLAPDPWQKYQRRLRDHGVAVRLDLVPAEGGMTMVARGRF